MRPRRLTLLKASALTDRREDGETVRDEFDVAAGETATFLFATTADTAEFAGTTGEGGNGTA